MIGMGAARTPIRSHPGLAHLPRPSVERGPQFTEGSSQPRLAHPGRL